MIVEAFASKSLRNSMVRRMAVYPSVVERVAAQAAHSQKTYSRQRASQRPFSAPSDMRSVMEGRSNRL